MTNKLVQDNCYCFFCQCLSQFIPCLFFKYLLVLVCISQSVMHPISKGMLGLVPRLLVPFVLIFSITQLKLINMLGKVFLLAFQSSHHQTVENVALFSVEEQYSRPVLIL